MFIKFWYLCCIYTIVLPINYISVNNNKLKSNYLHLVDKKARLNNK